MLGAMLVTEAALQLVAKSGLVASDFYFEKHEAIYRTILALAGKSAPSDRFQSPMR